MPQGSILGPILFNINVNDVADHITDCLLEQYADDTQFLHTSTADNLNLLIGNTESTLLRLKSYFLRNSLLLNSAKTRCIFIVNRQLLSLIPPNTRISFDGDIIHPRTHVENLGVYMDRYMTFDVHVSELNKKVIGTLVHIYRISLNFEKRTRTIVVQSLVLSIINYCIRIRGTTNATLLNNVQKLQNFAAKVAVGRARKYDHVSPIMKELKWLKIKEKYVFDTCTTMFKTMHGSYPEWLLSFSTVSEATGSITRQNNNLYVPKIKTDSGARSVAVRGPKLWNELPTCIKEAPNPQIFRRRLKNYLLSIS